MSPRVLFALVALVALVAAAADDKKDLGDVGLRQAASHEVEIERTKLDGKEQAKANIDLLTAAGQGDFAEVPCATRLFVMKFAVVCAGE